MDNAAYSAKNVILAKGNEINKLPQYIKKEYKRSDKNENR